MAKPATSFDIRPVRRADLPALEAIVDAVGLFPTSMLADMVAPHLDEPSGEPFWLTCEMNGGDGPVGPGGPGAPVGLAFGEPERMTHGTWNLLLIAVHPEAQGRGIGAAMMTHVETMLAARGARVLLIETSGLDEMAPTRAFYVGLGYDEEARIRDYYAAGDDKVVFWKALSPS